MLITMEGKIIRIDAGDIRKCGRGTSGVRLVKLNDQDKVASACVVPEENGNNNNHGKPDSQTDLPLQ